MSNLVEIMAKIEETYNSNLACHNKIQAMHQELNTCTDPERIKAIEADKNTTFNELIARFTDTQDFGVKALGVEEKVKVFQWVLNNSESIVSSGFVRNIILLLCAGSGTDDFANNPDIWFSSISQYTDCKIRLSKELTELSTNIAKFYWYIQCSMGLEVNLYSCISPEKYVKIPELYGVMLSSLTLEFISLILIKADYAVLSQILSEGPRFIAGARSRMEPIISMAKISIGLEKMISDVTSKK
jgi:hypothetical protein